MILLRILHTSDWHLGKSLEGYSRLEEQELFLEDFIKVVEENDVDLVIIAGDIYDNSNPPARAENLFYRALNRISQGGKRGILIISGNHDNPERLVAANPLAKEQGIIMVALPKTIVPVGAYGDIEVIDSCEGCIEVKIKDENAVIITLPYPSEKRLNEIISESQEDEIRRRDYAEKVGEILEKLSCKFREDTVNIIASHLFIRGGESSDSERPIELGGSLAIDVDKIPENAQYVALGHLHKPQSVKGAKCPVYYSGSPIQYSKSEINYAKCLYIADVKPKKEVKIETIMINTYKPIEVWKCDGIEEAIKKCEKNSSREVWVYLEITMDTFLSQEDIKTLRELKKDIVEIKPKIKSEVEEEIACESLKEKSMDEIFKEFYINQRGIEPEGEVMDLFLSIIQGDEEDEA